MDSIRENGRSWSLKNVEVSLNWIVSNGQQGAKIIAILYSDGHTDNFFVLKFHLPAGHTMVTMSIFYIDQNVLNAPWGQKCIKMHTCFINRERARAFQ